MNLKKSYPLSRVLLRPLLWRLFLPLLAVGFIAIGGMGYRGIQILMNQQKRAVQSMAQMVEQHLEQGGRILDAIARTAESSELRNVGIFMQSTWEAYRHFETLYYLDEKNRIKQLAPYDRRYLGLDMSRRLSDITMPDAPNHIAVSRPFISLRTGDPTVYLVRALAHGGRVVGELNLGALQQAIAREKDASGRKSTFILDQYGTLLAHPNAELVKEQTNLSDLEIFRRRSKGNNTLIYKYAGTMVLGNTARVSRVGWVVIDQIPLSVLLGPYVLTWGMMLLASLGIWLTLMWSLRKRFQREIITPLVKLGQSTNALAVGDFRQVYSLASIPASFTEVNRLADDFLQMSNILQVRQAALQESEKRYRNLFESVPVGIFSIAPGGMILDANQASVHMLGYPDHEALLAVNARDLYVSSADRERLRTDIDREGIVRDFETQLRRYDGKIIWVGITSRAARSDKGQILYEGVLEDITERKHAEEVLRESEKKYRSIVMENIGDGYFEIDLDCRITFINQAGIKMMGYPREDLIGMNYRSFMDQETIKAVKSLYKEVYQTGNPSEMNEWEIFTKGRIKRIMESSVSLMKDGNDRPIGFRSITRDVTARKQAEEEILALSITDQLTGLHNRRGFITVADQQLKLSDRTKRGMLLFFADLDGMKSINDTLGHEEGDKALMEVAAILKETFRAVDIMARMGGDEFAILAIDSTEVNSEIFMARLQERLDTHNRQENRRYGLDISIGCACYDPENPCSLDELIVRADRLMYENKRIKKSCR